MIPRRCIVIISVSTILITGCSGEKQSSRCADPPVGWLRPSDGRLDLAVVNTLVVEKNGELKWNGVKIRRSELTSYFKKVRNINPSPFTILSPHPEADCAIINSIRNEMNETLGCKNGGCGEGVGWR